MGWRRPGGRAVPCADDSACNVGRLGSRVWSMMLAWQPHLLSQLRPCMQPWCIWLHHALHGPQPQVHAGACNAACAGMSLHAHLTFRMPCRDTMPPCWHMARRALARPTPCLVEWGSTGCRSRVSTVCFSAAADRGHTQRAFMHLKSGLRRRGRGRRLVRALCCLHSSWHKLALLSNS